LHCPLTFGGIKSNLFVCLVCFCFFFCLDAKETKNQGKSTSGRIGSDRSARFSGQRAAKAGL